MMWPLKSLEQADVGNQDCDDNPNLDNISESARPVRPIRKKVQHVKYKDYKTHYRSNWVNKLKQLVVF